MPHTTDFQSEGGYSTRTAARKLDRAPQTLRRAHCEQGNYCGVVPVKLPNGGLLLARARD